MFNLVFFTDTGLKRAHNEDSILIDKKSSTFIIADGMGGHEKGEIASRIVAECFIRQNSDKSTEETENLRDNDTLVPDNSTEKELNHNIHVASRKMQEYVAENGIDGTIGSTVVGVKYITNIQAWALFHLGDSRAYLFKNNSLLQLTTDHSKHEELKRKNVSKEEIEKSGKNIITKAVGNFNPFPLEIQYISTLPQDILFLCSDGVSDLCTHEELLLLFIQYKDDLTLLSTQIKQLVYNRGARDNLSVIIVKIL